MSKKTYKLTYFHARGRGEFIRLVFIIAGVEFEDNRIDKEQWLALKATGIAPFGQLPLLEIKDDARPKPIVLCQSVAIMRYLANEFGISPDSNLDKASADMVVDAVMDIRAKRTKYQFENDATLKEKFIKMFQESLPGDLKNLQNVLEANDGGQGYFVGKKVASFKKVLNMPQYKLYYFNIRGRAEVTRLLFKAAGVNFEDKRLTGEEWAAMKATGKAPFGQMPLLEVDGKIVAQSMAIGRYVANEVGLAPPSNLEKAQADMIVDGCGDLGTKLMTAYFEKDESRKAQLTELAKAATPVFLKYFEEILRSNNGGKGFFIGDKLTYADITTFNSFNYLFAKGKQEVPDELKDFPLLADHYKRVMDVPNIKKWMEERPKTDL